MTIGSRSPILWVEEKEGAKDTEPYGIKERTVKRTATVQAIDLDKRVVTLTGEKGDVFDLINVKVGDQEAITNQEALAVSGEPAKKKKW